ncbi:MAG: nucleoside monophosphate kinase [Candidatus Moraniibacteriota bacterium]
MTDPKSYILIGPPGSGKSTLAHSLEKRLGVVHIDIGSELRRAAQEDTPFATEINDTINHKKELVSDMVVYGVLADALMRIPAGKGVVLDGAPRPASQIDEVLHILGVSGRKPERVIFINLPEAMSIERISRRFKCIQCEEPLILGTGIQHPTDSCPKCGGKVAQREDDTVEGVRKRYRIFQGVTLPVVEYFREHGFLLEVDGTLPSETIIEKVFQSLNQPKS